jgi:cytochrome c peroxidase
MKYGTKLYYLVSFILILLVMQEVSANSFKHDLLKKAALNNGYKLPIEVNSEFDVAKSNLGKIFFEDESLSFNSEVSCASCHVDDFSSADGLPIALGVGAHGKGIARINSHAAIVPRNVLPLWGRASVDFDTFFWDGKVQSKNGVIVSQFGLNLPSKNTLEVALNLPFVEIREMVNDTNEVTSQLMDETISSATHIQTELLRRVKSNSEIKERLLLAFDIKENELNFQHIIKSIRHFFSDKFKLQESKFSQFISGNKTLTSDEVDGGLIFYGKGKCATCHSGPHFSDLSFHTIITPQFGFGKNGFGVDYGRFNSTFNINDLYKFRTPPLHNVSKTSPYGFSGGVKNLSDIVEMHYDPLKFIDPSKLLPNDRRELFAKMVRVDNFQSIPTALSDRELRLLMTFLNTLSF